jgi:amino acid adenylation domain-containing protein
MNRYIDLLENSFCKHKKKKALVFENINLTYEELSIQATQLSVVIKNNINSNNTLIGIYLDHSHKTVVSMIASLKAGCSFLVLDKEMPSNRINQIIKEANPSLILTDDETKKIDSTILLYGSHSSNVKINTSISNNKIDDCAYIIFTSGSTGTPKGVKISNSSLTNYSKWFQSFAKLSDTDSTILLSSFSVDLGYTAIFPTLVSGGCLHILKKEKYLSISYLISYLKYNEITFLKLTPTYFSLLEQSEKFIKEFFLSIRLIIFGGEKIILNQVKNAFSLSDTIQVINHYGPCETTIGSLSCYLSPNELDKELPIGLPIANTQCYLFDNKQNPIKNYNQVGEIVIGGAGVSTGYINSNKLTNKKFLSTPNDRLYKTGDLGYYISGNNVVFVGRKDRQVKIKGYRIELDEIEQATQKIDWVNSVAVLHKNKQLYLFYTSSKGSDEAKLREKLNKLLPHYMLPKFISLVEKFPLLNNGKINYEKLANIDNSGLLNENADQNNRIQRFWNEETNFLCSDFDMSFFDAGGDSLSFVSMLGKIEKEYNVTCNYFDYISAPTINGIYSSLERDLSSIKRTSIFNSNYARILNDELVNELSIKLNLTKSNGSEEVELNPNQKLLFLHKNVESYIVPEVIEISDLNQDDFQNQLIAFINTHYILKAKIQSPKSFLVYNKIHKINYEIVDVSDKKFTLIDKLFKLFHTPFNFNSEFLYRLIVIKDRNRHFLFVFKNHIITDGSIRFNDMRHLSQSANSKEDLKELIVNYLEERDNEVSSLSKILINSYFAHIEENINLINQFRNKFTLNNNCNITDIDFDLDFLVFKNKSNFIYSIVGCFSHILCDSLNLSKIPINLFYNGRKYKGKPSYYGLFGDFHDNYLLNIVYDKDGAKIEEQIKTQLKFLKYKEINFTSYLIKYLRKHSSKIEYYQFPLPVTINIIIESKYKRDLEKNRKITEYLSLAKRHKKSSVKEIAIGIYIDLNKKKMRGSIRCAEQFNKTLTKDLQLKINKYLKT